MGPAVRAMGDGRRSSAPGAWEVLLCTAEIGTEVCRTQCRSSAAPLVLDHFVPLTQCLRTGLTNSAAPRLRFPCAWDVTVQKRFYGAALRPRRFGAYSDGTCCAPTVLLLT